MNWLIQFVLLSFLFNLLISCNGQTKNFQNHQISGSSQKNEKIGGPCEGCELIFVGMPKNIRSIDTSKAWIQSGQKLLVTGTVYKIDHKTPASNIIIYYWQTDNNGYYISKDGPYEQANQHGHIRGWIKSDDYGKYSLYTIKPKPYPNDNIPAHIHVLIKEPHLEYAYYIDNFEFEDDKYLTTEKIKSHENRGGSGVLKVNRNEDLHIAVHDIILGLNIPNYQEIK